jgi:hypothetical protein
MKRVLLVLATPVLLSMCASAQAPAEPGHFDYYLLNLFWSP